MIDVSLTMQSVRWMFEKHLKNIDLSIPATPIKETKDYLHRKKITDETVFAIRADAQRGMKIRELAEKYAVSQTVAHKIKHYQHRFSKGKFARNPQQ